MKIIIVGCGKVGMTLAAQLAKEKHELTVIDEKADRLHRITDHLDAMGIVGNGVNHTVLKEAGIESADLLIAVTGSDEKNLLCCVVAKKAGHCETIARIRNPIYNEEADFLRREFGISMIINQEYAAAEEIFRIFQFPSAVRVDSFAKGNVEMLHFKIVKDSPLIGKKLMQIRPEYEAGVLVCTVMKGDEVIIPNGSYVFEEGDTVAVVARKLDAISFFKKIGMAKNRVQNAILAGGGEMGFYLARMMLKAGSKVTLIEMDKARCEELSEELPDATIICGDATDQDLLSEEGFEHAQGFAALTGVDEENILLSLYAHDTSTAKVVTRVDRGSFNGVINKLNLGSLIYPRIITADVISKFVRSWNPDADSEVETLYKLADGKAEAVEFIIKPDSSFVGIPIQELKFRPNTLIGCIYRNRQVIIPSGQDSLQPGDSVLVVISDYSVSSIREIFVK